MLVVVDDEHEPYWRRGGWLGEYLGSGEARRGGPLGWLTTASPARVEGAAEVVEIVASFWLLPRRTPVKFRRTGKQCGGASVLECSRRRGECDGVLRMLGEGLLL